MYMILLHLYFIIWQLRCHLFYYCFIFIVGIFIYFAFVTFIVCLGYHLAFYFSYDDDEDDFFIIICLFFVIKLHTEDFKHTFFSESVNGVCLYGK